MEKSKKYQLLTVYHKPDIVFNTDIITPIHAGRELLKNKDDSESKSKLAKLKKTMIGDNTGDNISLKNSTYNEMTAIYWMWKNYDKIGNPKYVGLMHYRRHFCLNPETITKTYIETSGYEDMNKYIQESLCLTKKRLDEIFKTHEVIVTRPYYKTSVRNHFKESHNTTQLDTVSKIIEEKFPKYHESFENYLDDHYAYFCNMFIFPKKIFFEYCDFIFGVLEEFERLNGDCGRFYVSERLTGAFIRYLIDKKTKVLLVPTVYLEESITIDVAFATNMNYVAPTLVAIDSMLARAKSNRFFNIHILASGDTVKEINKRSQFLKDKFNNYKLTTYDLGNAFSKTKMSIKHISKETYYRLMLCDLLPNVDKILYLDSDIIVNGDLAPLFRSDISDKYVAGVRAAGYYHPQKWVDKHSEEIGIPSNDKYINAGVLLLNLKKIREDRIDKKMNKLVSKNYSSQDQDIINVACYDKIRILPLRYNTMTKYVKRDESGAFYINKEDEDVYGKADVDDALNNPIIIHFADKIKPWEDSSVPFAEKWYKHADKIKVESLYGSDLKKISVIVPIFNMEKYLGECLDSVFNQTLKDIEVICINDGSSDKSLSILKEYKKSHDNLVIVDQENHGVAYSRNVGLKLAKSEFVCFLDPDDFYPDKDILETLYKNAKKHNALVVGGSWMEIIEKPDGTSYFKRNFVNTVHSGYTFLQDGFISYSDYQFDFGYQRFIFSLDLIRENDISFPLLKRYQDPPFFVETMIKAKKFYALTKHTYCYRFGYQTKTIFSGQKLIDFTNGVISLLKLSKEMHYPNIHVRNLEQINRVSNTYLERITSGNDLELIDLLIKANSMVDRSLLREKGWDVNDDYMIEPLVKLVASTKNHLTTLKESRELLLPKEKTPFILFRPFIYIKNYGLVTTFVRIFKGREEANKLKIKADLISFK